MAVANGKIRVKWAEYPMEETRDIIANPFCGFYSIYRFEAPREVLYSTNEKITDFCLTPHETLALVEINLRAYQERQLDDAAFKMVERVFRRFKSERVTMLLRFLYDWEGKNIQAEPKTLSAITDHMEALSPLLKEYSPYIFVLQGLFIGNWGEMHNSRYLSVNSVCRLADKLSECAGENTFLAVRSPALWRVVTRSFNMPDLTDPHTPALALRVGLFNDGMLASGTDFGTYGDLRRIEAKLPGDKLIREEELLFQQKLCLFVPNGGETINPDPQNDFERALPDLKTMRVSYLNSGYDTDVYDKWKAYKLRRSWGDWRDLNGYKYIAAHIGYRFLISDVKLFRKSGTDIVTVSMNIENTGFAPCYRRLKVSLGLSDASSGAKAEAEVNTDSRLWRPSETTAISADIDAKDIKASRLLVYINALEPVSGLRIRFANSFATVGVSEDSVLGVYALRG